MGGGSCREKKQLNSSSPPEAARNERGCSMATFSAGRRRHRIARPALPMHPPTALPPPQPIHHTQNASRRPGSSPAGRRKIDLFVFGGKGSARGASGSQKKRKRQEAGVGEDRYRGVCLRSCVSPSHAGSQTDKQIDIHAARVSACLCVIETCPQTMVSIPPSSFHSAVSACAVYLSYLAYLISFLCTT